MSRSRIKLLEPRLANQIAAGEVVERPSAIVKELLENSLDADAKNIHIDIEKGGVSRIAVRDDGVGIQKDDLGLALSRHATSKISSSDDLQCIQTLGFRGEALASICSVSHLIIQSHAQGESDAWQISAEGRELNTKVVRVSHPVGTTVEVRDLFFNLPARRKFLRSEKTEFMHIEDLVKRIVLSRSDVSIILTHNGRKVLKVAADQSDDVSMKRIEAVCGKTFSVKALKVDCAATDLQLKGYVGPADFSHSHTDLQYFFLNGRMIKDKIINHAIRQAYIDLIYPGRYPCYVLYLTLDPKSVDVNVHPTKHEVRFRDRQLIHDFIHFRLSEVLGKVIEANDIQYTTSDLQAVPALQVAEVKASDAVSRWDVHAIIDDQYALVSDKKDTYFCPLAAIIKTQLANTRYSSDMPIVTQTLLFPVRFNVALTLNNSVLNELKKMGFSIVILDNKEALVKQIPEVLQYVDRLWLSDALAHALKKPTLTAKQIIDILSTPRFDASMELQKEQVKEWLVSLNKKAYASLKQISAAMLQKITETEI